jgi:hypothetical protein
VRTATRLGTGVTAFGLLLVLLDLVERNGSSSCAVLVMGVVVGLCFGRAVEAKAQDRGEGLRDE